MFKTKLWANYIGIRTINFCSQFNFIFYLGTFILNDLRFINVTALNYRSLSDWQRELKGNSQINLIICSPIIENAVWLAVVIIIVVLIGGLVIFLITWIANGIAGLFGN